MSDSPTNSTATLDPITHDREPEAVSEAPAVAVTARLDSPIERIDLGTPDTFIPESVDQLLAHSRRYPLLLSLIHI